MKLNKFLICFLLLFANCLSMPSTSNLPSPTVQKNSLKEEILLEKINVLDSENIFGDKSAIEENLTLNLKNYLERGKYFEKVVLFTEKDSYLENKSFQFYFDTYAIKRKPYKWYFPLAIITLTMYIWFGGTITIDEVQMSGGLEVKDSKNNKVFITKKEIFEEREINLYSSEVSSPNSTSARGKFFFEILEEYKIKSRR
jgi:hypothetical protein